jgi:hypothetical protein
MRLPDEHKGAPDINRRVFDLDAALDDPRMELCQTIVHSFQT